MPGTAANVPPSVVGAGVKKGGGRAELPDEGKATGGGGAGEKEKVGVMSEVVSPVSPVSPASGKVEMDGLRPEELDSEGRYLGELHGDGRQFGGWSWRGVGF